MTTADDRLSRLRQQLAESITRLGELDVLAINAVVGGKTERDISALETRKAQARDRVALLTKAIKQLEHQRQLDAQAFMTRETAAFMGPLIEPLDRASAALLLPPHNAPAPKLEPEVIPTRKTGRWFGNPKQGGSRWNERAR